MPPGTCLWKGLAVVHVLVGSTVHVEVAGSVADRELWARGLQARPSTHVSLLPSQTFQNY